MNKVARLRTNLNKVFPKQFDLDVGAGDLVLLTVISEQFDNLNQIDRLKMVAPFIQAENLIMSIIELYTPEEAKTQTITLVDTNNDFPASWQEAVDMLAAGKTKPHKKIKHSIKLKRVVFYSYKGGVGRTTALIQTAFQLTRAGKRVAIVDMDVEAPGLQALLPRDPPVETGLIDYLWERQICLSKEIQLNDIVYSVTDTESKRPVFIVPAGKIEARYVQRLSLLSTTHLFAKEDDPWYQFEQDLWSQYQPDIILIDARTGLNEWGGLSLLQLADDAFITLYPSAQNAEGINFIRTLLKQLGGIEAQLIVSPIPEGSIGETLIKRIATYLKLNDAQTESLIQIPYHPNIAASDQFPVETALSYYAKIANSILEKEGVAEASALITKDNRLELVRSLSFPEPNAASIVDIEFDTLFQKTADFERCLEDTLWIIRGRKGTGKSTLYTLFTQHCENAEKRARGRLRNITILSAHGPSGKFRPTSSIFEEIQKKLSDKQVDWLSLWRAYSVICIYRACPKFSQVLRKKKLKSLISRLEYNFKISENLIWRTKHTKKLLEFSTDFILNSYCSDALKYFNLYLQSESKKIWLLYDDLDQDINENSAWQNEALGGLMRFVYDLNNQNIYAIRFKIFLREDIWNKLVFTNKSHFGESRTLLLQWGKTDFFA